MEKIEISYLQFADVMELLRDDYRWTSKEMIIKEYEKLKNRFIAEPNRRIDNPSMDFLFNAVNQFFQGIPASENHCCPQASPSSVRLSQGLMLLQE